MGWLHKLFGKQETSTGNTNGTEKDDELSAETSRYSFLPGLDPSIRIGRYTDYYKSKHQRRNWQLAETKFGEKQYADALFAFFDFLSDTEEKNLTCHPGGEGFHFSLLQGSRKVTGIYDGTTVRAYTPIAYMPEPGTAIMRKLLELNYTLYYSHSAISPENKLKMIFSAPVQAASPSRLYFGLKELAIKADQIDDMLLSEFPTLQQVASDHIQKVPERELETKYKFFRSWVEETLAQVAALNHDTFSGAIAYYLLSLVYRMDFLLTPEGKLLAEIEKIHTLYWTQQEEVGLAERNQKIYDAIRKLLDMTKEEFASCIYRTGYTFSIAQAPQMEKITEYITAAGNDAGWYMSNHHPQVIPSICEYCLLYTQFVYSLPKVFTELIQIFMVVRHPDFFQAFGMRKPLYNTAIRELDRAAIMASIDQVIANNRSHYPALSWSHDQISYQNIWEFGISFCQQFLTLNLETDRN